VDGDARLLERAAQLTELEGHWAAVRSTGQGRFVAVGGEAGAGKTSLIRRFCDQAEGRPRVMVGACDALFTARPLGPFVDIGELASSVSDAISRGGRADEIASAFLAEARSGGPAVVVLEDLHWADEATLDVLRLLARRLGPRTILLLATYRDDELDRAHPLRMLLGELPAGGARVRVPPLSEAGVRELARGAGLDGAELYRKTGGNPFFVTEVLATHEQAIPETVRDAVLARVARLGNDSRAVVEAVAIAPPHAEMWLIEEMVPGAAEQLGSCLASGVIAESAGAIAFRHELARLAVEEALDPGRRLTLHRRALAALAQPPHGRVDLARLAHHAEAAVDSAAVLRYAPAAAAEAAALGAHREAVAQYERALRHAHHLDPGTRAVLLERRCHEGYLAGQHAEAAQAGRAAVRAFHELGDQLQEAGALLKLAKVQRVGGDVTVAEASVAEAVALLGEVGPCRELAMAYAATAGIALCHGRAEETLTAGRAALRLAEQLEDTEALLDVLITVGTQEMEAATTRPEGRDKLARGIELGKLEGLDELVGRAYNNLAYEELACRDLDAAEACLAGAVEFSTTRGAEVWLHCALGARSELQLLRGQWQQAVETAGQVLQSCGTPLPRIAPLTVIGLVRARRGEPDAWGPLDEAKAVARASGELQMMVGVTAARAELAWLEGRPAVAIEETEPVVNRALRSSDAWALPEIAYWRWRAGVRESIAEHDTSPRRLQMTGHAREAAEQWAALGYPYEAALAMADSGDEQLLRTALADLRSLGAAATAAVVARWLRERGARGIPRGPRASTATNPAQLTNRQAEVVALIAEGLRDADIAQRLYLSEKTVGHHVSAILRKLGVRTRGQAAAEAVQLGLIGEPPA
jgi:DNA-binding CsgD family transcriptional regulator/tetratricopeptide (TPR) repeat protein